MPTHFQHMFKLSANCSIHTLELCMPLVSGCINVHCFLAFSRCCQSITMSSNDVRLSAALIKNKLKINLLNKDWQFNYHQPKPAIGM